MIWELFQNGIGAFHRLFVLLAFVMLDDISEEISLFLGQRSTLTRLRIVVVARAFRVGGCHHFK